jgi:hypothetical protein
MRRRALVFVAVLLAGCGSSGSTTKGSGHVVTEKRSVGSFSSIELIGAATVDVFVGKPTALTIRGDDNILPLIRTSVSNGALVVASKHSYSSRHDLRLEIGTPALDGVTLTGAGTFSVGGIHANAFSVDLSGAATMILAGTTGTLDVRLSGAGTADLGDLVARDAHASLSGTGSLHVHATRSLDASLSGVGSIVYTGTPRHVKTQVSGVGTIVAG